MNEARPQNLFETTSYIWELDSGAAVAGSLSELPRMIITDADTEQTANRINIFRDEIMLPAGLEMNVSLNPCIGINTNKIVQMLHDNGILIGSIDVTGKYGPLDLFGDIIKGNRNYSDIRVLVREAAYMLLCAPTDNSWKKMLEESLDNGDIFNDQILVRANSGFWLDNSNYGEKILSELQQRSSNNNFALAIEPLDVGHEDFADFLRLVSNIRESNPWLDVGISFDGAHISEVCSKGKRPVGQINSGSAEQAVDHIILNDLADRVIAVEINQIDTEGHTHLPAYTDSGLVNYRSITQRLSDARRRKGDFSQLHIIIEHDPRDFNIILMENKRSQTMTHYVNTFPAKW